MIHQFAMLCRVKELHEQSSLKTMRAKRAAVDAARHDEEAQRALVAESLQALPIKEAAVFEAILQATVSIQEIDETKAKALKLQEDHQALVDEAERLHQMRLRCEKDLITARAEYQMAQRNLQKFTNIKSDLETEQNLAQEAREELEIEELFSKGQALPL